MIGLVAEWVDEGETSRDRPIAPLHLHRSEDEAWYVLEGRLGFRMGDEEIVAEAGNAVIVPAGMPHRFSALDGPIVYLVYRFEPK